jgi:hypothetical protein
MNWNLITKDKQGEVHVNFFWVSLLIVFCGFLFGLGLSLADLTINTTFGNDGYYIYFFIKKYFIGIILVILFILVSTLKSKEK